MNYELQIICYLRIVFLYNNNVQTNFQQAQRARF